MNEEKQMTYANGYLEIDYILHNFKNWCKP